jgi:hypothetical protein
LNEVPLFRCLHSHSLPVQYLNLHCTACTAAVLLVLCCCEL